MQVAKSLRKKFESFVRSKCDIKEEHFENIYSIYSDFFSKLAKARSGGASTYPRKGTQYFFQPWSIFTTNYDLCVEEFCREQNLGLNTGTHFVESRKQVVVGTRSLLTDGDRLSLVKLHGSLNWFRQDDGMIIEHHGTGQRTFGLHKVVGEVMLYPIREKEMYLNPYLHMMYYLDRRLQLSNDWLVIGYRFNDEIIKTMFANHSKNKKMMVVHPNPEEFLVKYEREYAIAKLGLTKTHLFTRVKNINKEKPFQKRIKPYNFVLVGSSTSSDRKDEPIVPLTSFTRPYDLAPHQSFTDANSGKLYVENTEFYWKKLDVAIEEYVDHPESKFKNRHHLGIMKRMHLVVDSIVYLGKESNELEETEILGVKEYSYINYVKKRLC